MLIAIGPNVTSAQDYTSRIGAPSIQITQNQGDTLDTLKCIINDPYSNFGVGVEDEVYVIEENDPNGWPTVNLIDNASFDGTYVGGVAPNWSANTTTGYTASLSGTAFNGSNAQQLAFSNAAVGSYYFTQQLALPTDEFGNVINSLPYYFSIYASVTTAATNITPIIEIEWWTAVTGGSFISASTASLSTGTTGGYRRYYVNGKPPSNAAMAKGTLGFTVNAIAAPTAAPTLGTATTGGTVPAGTYTIGYTWKGNVGESTISPTAQIVTTGTTSTITVTPPALPSGITGYQVYIAAVNTTTPLFIQSGGPFTTAHTFTSVTATGANPPASNTATTNSYTVIVDTAQFEYATFGNYNVPLNNTLATANPYFTDTVGNTVAANWVTDGSTTGVTYTVIDNPSIGNTAQQIACSAVAASNTTRAVSQQLAVANPLWNYQLTVQYQIVTQLTTNAHIRMGVNYEDINQQFLQNVSVNGPNGEPPSTGWETISVNVGPAYSGIPSAGVYWLKIFAGVADTVEAQTNTIILGAVILTPLTSMNPQSASALAAQMYPTVPVLPLSSFAVLDTITGQYFRQWRYFGGFVKNAVYDYSASGDRYIEVDANDFSVLLQEAPATILILSMQDNAAIQKAGDYASGQGFLQGLDYTTNVSNIGKVDAMLFNWRTTRDVLTEISNQTLAAYWVDPYKFLWYQPALATSAPFGLSDQPDATGANTGGVPTYPMSGLRWNQDSTDTVNAPVIEGSTQLSAPQTFTGSGSQTTTTAALTGGTAYSSIPVTALTQAIADDTPITITDGSHTITVYANGTFAIGATTINISPSVTPSATIATAATFKVTGYNINNRNPIAQIDSVTLGGVAQGPIGLYSVNTYSQGYTLLIDVAAGILYFQTPPPTAANNVSIVYRYASPVIVRLTAPWSGGAGRPHRKIHSHQKETHITSQQAAIDRANAELAIAAKAKPVGDIILVSPTVPFDPGLHAGQAIAVWFSKANTANNQLFPPGQLFQIQSNEIRPAGNGVFVRTLKVGFYRPDLAIYLAQQRRADMESTDNNNTVLQDVLTSLDSMALTDSMTHTVSNLAVWYSGTPPSNAYGWGPVTAPIVQGVWG